MYTHQQDSEDEDLEDNSFDIDKNGLGSEAPSNYNYGRRRSRAVLYQLAGSYKTNSNDKATKKIHAKLGGANVSTSLFYFLLQSILPQNVTSIGLTKSRTLWLSFSFWSLYQFKQQTKKINAKLGGANMSTQFTVFPHTVAAATILLRNCKTLKNSYSFCISFSLM